MYQISQSSIASFYLGDVSYIQTSHMKMINSSRFRLFFEDEGRELF